MHLKNTRNLIFDLGGVIIDLSVERTVREFALLTGFSEAEIQHAYLQKPVFFAYEKGLISSEEFRQSLREIFSFSASDEKIDQSWNAMLLDLPAAKLKLLTSLKKHYRTTALSNTNEIHLDYVNRIMLNNGLLDSYFHVSHYSHIMNKRKPEAEIYQQVLRENNFVAEETLFLDDNSSNITAAAELGIKTFHVSHPDEVMMLFKSYV